MADAERRSAQQLRNEVDYETARNAVSMGDDHKGLVDESTAKSIISRVKSHPWAARITIRRALSAARKEGRQEGLAFGYGQDGIVQEMVSSHLWVTGVNISVEDPSTNEAEDTFTRHILARPVWPEDPVRPDTIIESGGGGE